MILEKKIYVGYCQESLNLVKGESYEKVSPFVVDGDEYDEGYHLLDSEENIVGYCEQVLEIQYNEAEFKICK